MFYSLIVIPIINIGDAEPILNRKIVRELGKFMKQRL